MKMHGAHAARADPIGALLEELSDMASTVEITVEFDADELEPILESMQDDCEIEVRHEGNEIVVHLV